MDRMISSRMRTVVFNAAILLSFIENLSNALISQTRIGNSANQALVLSKQRSHHQAKAFYLSALDQEEELAAGTTNEYTHDAVVVGGGPAGLATALLLAKRGWEKVLVLEKRAAADSYEPELGFTYNIDGRGQRFMKAAGVMDKLKEGGVPSDEIFITRLNPDGSSVESEFPVIDPNAESRYWISRSQFLSVLYSEIEEKWSEQVQVLFGSSVEGFEHDEASDSIRVKAKVKGMGTSVHFRPKLIVGSDGLNSLTREALRSIWEEDQGVQAGGKNPFVMNKIRSAAAGLRYKVLTLPPKFILGKDTNATAISEKMYVAVGANEDPKTNIRLGCLPSKNPNEPRPANIITKPDHNIWKVRDADEFLKYLEDMFPQLDVKSLISKDQAHSFVNTRNGRFCEPQYCNQLYYNKNNTSVILVGDAIHAFPPDLGQGVNSALEDIMAFDNALQSTQTESLPYDLQAASQKYQESRLADAKALIKLMQLGGPYQYRQSKIGITLWGLNFMFRKTLHQLFPKIFSPQIFMMVTNPAFTYSQVLAKANKTTRRIWYCILLVGIFFRALILKLPL